MADRLVGVIIPAVEWLAGFLIRRWLLVVNVMLLAFILPTIAAPLLMNAGLELPARVIYTVYRPTCHQLPERSFFIAGHKVAVCARCSALYLSFWAAGLLYGAARLVWFGRVPAWRAPGLSWVLAASVPLAIDGLTQLAGLRESTNLLRAITGTLCGVAAGAFIYPHLHGGFHQAAGEHARNRDWAVPREPGGDLWVR